MSDDEWERWVYGDRAKPAAQWVRRLLVFVLVFGAYFLALYYALYLR